MSECNFVVAREKNTVAGGVRPGGTERYRKLQFLCYEDVNIITSKLFSNSFVPSGS